MKKFYLLLSLFTALILSANLCFAANIENTSNDELTPESIAAARSSAIIRPPADSNQFSSAVLKPGSDLNAYVPNFTPYETLLIIPYNIGANSNYKMTVIDRSAPAQTSAGTAAVSKAQTRAASTETKNTRISLDKRMRETEKMTIKDFAYNSPARKLTGTVSRKQAAIGDNKDFWCLSSISNWPPAKTDYKQIHSKLLSIGEHCYIYEDQETPEGYQKLTAEDVAAIQKEFDTVVYPKITNAFGSEPNPGIDNDPKLHILFTWNINQLGFSGYFDSINQLTQKSLEYYNNNDKEHYYISNEKELITMNAPANDFNGPFFRQYSTGILAHEFQHMISYNMRSKNNIMEETWLSEGLAQVAQDIAGYGYQYGVASSVVVPFFKKFGPYSLLDHDSSSESYGYDYLFARYLIDRGAVPKNLVITDKLGRENVACELKSKKIADDFDSFYVEFLTTLGISNKNLKNSDPYNFKSINIEAKQPDGTVLKGITPTCEFASIPFSYAENKLREYGFNVLKCETALQYAPEIKFEVPKNSGIGVIILRIRK